MKSCPESPRRNRREPPEISEPLRPVGWGRRRAARPRAPERPCFGTRAGGLRGGAARRGPGRGLVRRSGAVRLGSACPEMLPDEVLSAPAGGPRAGVALPASPPLQGPRNPDALCLRCVRSGLRQAPPPTRLIRPRFDMRSPSTERPGPPAPPLRAMRHPKYRSRSEISGGPRRALRGAGATASRPTRRFHWAETPASRGTRDVDLTLHLP